MATEVILPRVDMDMTTGRIARWYVEEGGTVEKGQPLFEIETDKAAMEIEAPSTGILRKLGLDEALAIPVGSTVGWICGPDEAPGEKAPSGEAAADMPSKATVVTAEAEASPAPAGAVAATPLARRLAAQYRIALADVPGSGPRRRIQARDVERAAQPALVQDAPTPSPEAAPPAAPRRVAHPATAGLHRVWLRTGHGRPLVLVHGFGADLNIWRPLVASLTTTRPILAVDLPGHGGTSALPAPSLTALADAVAEALAAEDLSAVDLVGHSLGAAVATEVADTAVLDVRSLFLIAPAGLGPDINGDFIAGFCRATTEASLAPWLRLLVADESALSPSFIRATARLRDDDAVVRAQTDLARVLFPDGTQAFSIRPALERLDRPVRIVVGIDDRIIPAHHALSVPGLVAVHRLRGIGHMPNIESRPLLARILSHHLQMEGHGA